MRLHRFFVEEKIGDKQAIDIADRDLTNQWKRVFRLQSGDQIFLLDNTGYEFLCSIEELASSGAKLKVLESKEVLAVPRRDVYLFVSLIKKDNFEWVLQKGTEIGVSHFVPLLTERTEKKDLNFERSRSIIKEASEQCGRGVMPVLYGIKDVSQVISDFLEVQKFVLNMGGKNFDQSDFSANSPVGFFIGPEGGWTEKELDIFEKEKLPTYSMGQFTLRAETAAVAVASLSLLG